MKLGLLFASLSLALLACTSVTVEAPNTAAGPDASGDTSAVTADPTHDGATEGEASGETGAAPHSDGSVPETSTYDGGPITTPVDGGTPPKDSGVTVPEADTGVPAPCCVVVADGGQGCLAGEGEAPGWWTCGTGSGEGECAWGGLCFGSLDHCVGTVEACP
jgi:hypothetical protein